MSHPTSILIIEKVGNIKMLTIKEYLEEDLYKKCGFKKADGFQKQTEWLNIQIDGNIFSISVFAKTIGKTNAENKYHFPPPIDNTHFFGNCAVVCSKDLVVHSLNIELWDKIVLQLFKGFTLEKTDLDDDEALDHEEEVDLNVSDIGSELSEEEYEI
jgi:hypothetical protein